MIRYHGLSRCSWIRVKGPKACVINISQTITMPAWMVPNQCTSWLSCHFRQILTYPSAWCNLKMWYIGPYSLFPTIYCPIVMLMRELDILSCYVQTATVFQLTKSRYSSPPHKLAPVGGNGKMYLVRFLLYSPIFKHFNYNCS